MSRYFFALWPDVIVRKKILAFRSACVPDGKLVAAKNLHITILFLGHLNINQLQKVISEANKINLPGFHIQLNHSGHFTKSKVSWLGLKTIPDTLLELHQAVSVCAQSSRIALDNRPYIPHLTLAKKSILAEKQTIRPIDWNIDHFVLLESIDTSHGVHYQIIKNYPLSTEAN